MPDQCNGLLIVSKNAINETSILNITMAKHLQLDTQAEADKKKYPCKDRRQLSTPYEGESSSY